MAQVLRAQIDMWNRRLELDALGPLGNAVRNKLPFFAGKVLAGTRNSIEQNSVWIEDSDGKTCSKELIRIFGVMNLLLVRVFNRSITGFFVFAACDALNSRFRKSTAMYCLGKKYYCNEIVSNWIDSGLFGRLQSQIC